jgi:enoyl-CoA hydratase
MTADTIDATCAEKLGLVNDVVQTVELIDTCKALVQKITSMAPFAVAQVVQSVYAHFKSGIDGFDTEIELFGKCVATQDFVEGTDAFLGKRKANFHGK